MCVACATTEQLNVDRQEVFANKLVETLNSAGLSLMLSLGHRTGLFDVMADMRGGTVREIADAASLSERYVREWLGSMVCGGVVELDGATGRYRLPQEHAAFLTRKATPNNLAGVMQWIGVLGSAEGAVAEAFLHGKGVPYTAYDNFDNVMAEESGQTVIAGLDQHILPLMPGMAARLEAGIDVLDVGCGRGRAIMYLAERYPKSRFTGYDFSQAVIAHACHEAQRRELKNVRFAVRDTAQLEEKGKYDLVTTFDAIHDQARPDEVLRGIRAALKQGGVYLCQEIKSEGNHAKDVAHPFGTFLYTISLMHCMSVSLYHGGPGLGAAWGRETCGRMLREAGFEKVERHELPHDPINDFYVCAV